MKTKKIWILLFLLPTIILFLFIYAIPLYIVFFTSFFEYRLFPNRFEFVGLSNYIKMIQDIAFQTAFKNTIVWILIHCSVHVTLGVILALILYKKPKGWKFVRVTYMIPNIISNAAIAMIFVNIFNPQYGVVNTFLKMLGLEKFSHNWLHEQGTAFPCVTMIWLLFAGYTTTLVLGQALAADNAVIEAAKVDGATNFQIDIFIMLPMLKKIIGTTMVMAATYMLTMFDLIYITTNGGPGIKTTNIPLLLYKTSMTENNFGYANTMGVVIIVLGIIIMNIINRMFKVNDMDY